MTAQSAGDGRRRAGGRTPNTVVWQLTGRVHDPECDVQAAGTARSYRRRCDAAFCLETVPAIVLQMVPLQPHSPILTAASGRRSQRARNRLEAKYSLRAAPEDPKLLLLPPSLDRLAQSPTGHAT